MGRKKKVNRAQMRKAKSKWKAKSWYMVYAPELFGKAEIGQCLAREPETLIGRNLEPTLNDLNGDFSKSHIKPKFKITDVSGNQAFTMFIGHRLTSDYTRRLTYRRSSKIDGIFNVTNKDGCQMRVKLVATTRNRIQTSQKKALRQIMEEIIMKKAKKSISSDFIKDMLDGNLSKDIFYACKKLYPLKRIEFRRSELVKSPTSTPDEGIDLDEEETETAEPAAEVEKMVETSDESKAAEE